MGGSQIWLDTTETLTVHEMLKAICVVSANDCCVAMAEYLAGSQEMFVEQMNKRAKELGMNDTTFKNCHGIDEDGIPKSVGWKPCKLNSQVIEIFNVGRNQTQGMHDTCCSNESVAGT